MLIAHFTDPHVTERPERISWRHLANKRLLGWANLVIGGLYGEFAGAVEILRALVDDLMRVAPDWIVSTGDLTGLSLESEFESARVALHPLLDDLRVTGIPGNHDVYVPNAVDEKLYESAFGSWTRTDLSPGDFPEENEMRTLYPYPLVRFLGAKVVLVCLRDVRPNAIHDSSGMAGETQLRALDRLLAGEQMQNRIKIVALHYGLCRSGGQPDSRHHGLRDAGPLIEILSRRDVALLLHGHLHERFVIRRAFGGSMTIANPGSLASRKPHHSRAYHLLRIQSGSIELEARRFDGEELRFIPWKDAPGTGVIWRGTGCK